MNAARMNGKAITAVMGQLPILNKVVRWFKGDDLNIDNHLFKLHYQASTLVIVIGFIVISEKNYIDMSGKAILCHTQMSEYARSYCWIHGTSYVRQALQGQATGCFVDQTRIQSEEDAPVTAYYLWLPYLLTICFLLARLPRSLWKRFLECGLVRNILKGRGGHPHQLQEEIAQNFLDYRPKYARYHVWFAVSELLNIACVIISMLLCHWLLNYQFGLYGLKVLEYLGTEKRVNEQGQYVTHDPMCELFPTEVACTLRYGASTGALDRTNFLCIMGNNLFNQKYFFVLWLWWSLLLLLSLLGLAYRLARLALPSLSRTMLLRLVPGQHLASIHLSAADYFMLEQVVQNLPDSELEGVLEEVEKGLLRARAAMLGLPSGSLPSVMVVEDGGGRTDEYGLMQSLTPSPATQCTDLSSRTDPDAIIMSTID